MKNIKEFFKFLCAAVYGICLLIGKKQHKRVVLYYHGIDKSMRTGFKKQMNYLTIRCLVVPASEINCPRYESNIYQPVVAIMFDDAFQNLLNNAIPILRRLGLPAAICVPAGNLGGKPKWQFDQICRETNEPVMTKQQLINLDREGFEVFSHTMNHPDLSKLSATEVYSELKDSKKFLEQALGHSVRAISYPHGSHDGRVLDQVRHSGYEIGFTIEPYTVGRSTNCLQIGRVPVSPHDPMICFKLKVMGAYEITAQINFITKYVKNLFKRVVNGF